MGGAEKSLGHDTPLTSARTQKTFTLSPKTSKKSMKHPQILQFLLPLTLTLAACGNKTTTETTTPATAQTDTQAPAEKWLEVRYDDLRLRETASMEGKVLATLKTGDRVKDLGEWSPQTETVTLRKERITAPWGKVQTQSGQEGWIFLGALAPAPDPSVAELKKALLGIKGDDCKVIQQGMDRFREKMQGKPDHIVDQGVPVLDWYIDSTVLHLNTALSQSKDFPDFEKLGYPDENGKDHVPAPSTQKKIEEWKACGLYLDFPEGMITINANPGLTTPVLDPLVTPAMKTYLEQRAKENKEGWSVDAALIITPQQLAERAVFWDEFLVQNPTFAYVPRIRTLAEWYANDLITGQNNTPALGYEGGILDPEFKKAYEWVLKEHPKTETARKVQEWYDILKASAWKQSKKSDEYVNKLYQES
jgi:hypothetical protein